MRRATYMNTKSKIIQLDEKQVEMVGEIQGILEPKESETRSQILIGKLVLNCSDNNHYWVQDDVSIRSDLSTLTFEPKPNDNKRMKIAWKLLQVAHLLESFNLGYVWSMDNIYWIQENIKIYIFSVTHLASDAGSTRNAIMDNRNQLISVMTEILTDNSTNLTEDQEAFFTLMRETLRLSSKFHIGKQVFSHKTAVNFINDVVNIVYKGKDSKTFLVKKRFRQVVDDLEHHHYAILGRDGKWKQANSKIVDLSNSLTFSFDVDYSEDSVFHACLWFRNVLHHIFNEGHVKQYEKYYTEENDRANRTGVLRTLLSDHPLFIFKFVKLVHKWAKKIPDLYNPLKHYFSYE